MRRRLDRALPWLCLALSLAILLPRCFENSRITPRQGSWHFPRGGPYILGVDGSDKAELWIDGNKVSPCGRRHCWRVFAAGVYAYEIKAAADEPAWLVWHPPGRRGQTEIEYVPPSSLSPLPPPQAKFSRPGTYYGDGLRLLFVAGLWLAWLVYRTRGWFRVRENRWLFVQCAAIFALALSIRLIGVSDHGQTWDEDVNWAAGRNYVQNVLNADFAESLWRSNFEHPPLTKYILGIASLFEDGYTTARVFSSVLGALTCVLLLLTGRNLFGSWTGGGAGLVLATMPHAIAHSRVAGHESPTLFLWSLALFWVTRDNWRERSLYVGMGVLVGLSASVRFIGGLVGVAMGATALLRRQTTVTQVLVRGACVAVPTAVLTMIVVWPRLWHGPVTRIAESLSHLNRAHGVEPFHGAFLSEQPAYYFADYVWATTPLLVLLFALAYIFVELREKQYKRLTTVGVWLLVPLVATLSPVKQDGLRYVLPVLLPLSLAAAAGAVSVATHVRNSAWLRGSFLAVVIGYTLVVGLRVRPYYLDFYSLQVGGTGHVAAVRRNEFAWWGEGLHQAVKYINRHARTNDRVLKPWPCVPPGHLVYLRHDLYRPSNRRNADWLLVYAPLVNGRHSACQPRRDFVLAYEAKVDGASLVHVYRRR